jgi:prepilin-type N-terminal cleavage/methylation domain-containing protein
VRRLKRNDKGVTLIELVISIAILALLMVAVIGVMNTNVVIFRKSKADLAVQSSAQDVYNHITDSIMQAKYVEIEGYTSDTPLSFVTTDIGGERTATLTFNKYLKASEIAKLPAGSQAEYTEFKTLKTLVAGTTDKFEYKDVYLTKLKVVYAVPLQNHYVPDGVDTTGLDKDECTVEYTFEGNVMKMHMSYKYMQKLNTGDADDDSRVYANQLNYVTVGSGTGEKKITGAVAQVDAEDNSIAVTLYFADKSMSYKTVGMMNIRNSYVLYDAK